MAGDVRRRFDPVGRLVVAIHEPSEIAKHLSAPNAEAVRNYHGQLCAIRLASFGNDRGHSGECHGNSIVTTERCKNVRGEYIGTLNTLKHKMDRTDQ